jgi:hypothetical protein
LKERFPSSRRIFLAHTLQNRTLAASRRGAKRSAAGGCVLHGQIQTLGRLPCGCDSPPDLPRPHPSEQDWFAPRSKARVCSQREDATKPCSRDPHTARRSGLRAFSRKRFRRCKDHFFAGARFRALLGRLCSPFSRARFRALIGRLFSPFSRGSIRGPARVLARRLAGSPR